MLILGKNLYHLLCRIRPIVIYFLLCRAAWRTFLIIESISFSKLDYNYFGKIIVFGCISDLWVVILLLIPYILYTVFLPRECYGALLDRFVVSIFFCAYIFLFISILLLEIFFWNEFQKCISFATLNPAFYFQRIVDSVINTCPVMLLVCTIVITCVILLFWHHRSLWIQNYRANYLITKHSRIWFIILLSLISCISFVFTKYHDNVPCSQCIASARENIWYEMAKIVLSSNNVNNDLSYASYYSDCKNNKEFKIYQKKLRSVLLRELEEDGVIFSHNWNSGVNRMRRSSVNESRHNVIMITLDGIGANSTKHHNNAMNREKHGSVVKMPYFNMLAKKSAFFSKAYATSMNFSDSIVSILLSMPPMPGTNVSDKILPDMGLTSIGTMFLERGYDAKFIATHATQFKNIMHFIQNSGLQYVLAPSIENTLNEDSAYHNPLLDELLLADISYKKHLAFFHIIALSTDAKSCNNSEKFIDESLEEFMSQASRKPWFKNTIFIITSARAMGSLCIDFIDVNNYHVPLLIYAPSILEPVKIDQIVSQIDIAPTLASLLHFSYTSGFYGKDALHSRVNRAFMKDRLILSYIDDNDLLLLLPRKNFAIMHKSSIRNLSRDLSNMYIKLLQSSSHLASNDILLSNMKSSKAHFGALSDHKNDANHEIVDINLRHYRIIESALAMYAESLMKSGSISKHAI